MAAVTTGLERLINEPNRWLSEERLGLLCNPASVDRQFRHARTLVDRTFTKKLQALYSPQHGFFAEKQDNMIESADMIDPVLKIPVFSLYGNTRVPTEHMLETIDALLVDLQDVGTRVYTFIYTLSYCLETARKSGVRVLVLDRPNPINGVDIEGNCLAPECASFVGRYPIPMRHGMTIGELARLINEYFDIGCELTVVPMSGWRRTMRHEETGLPWVAPSPNMPTPITALVYPGQVVWEGTNLSEGRGTALPFELFGAPYLDLENILSFLGGQELPGVILRPTVFEPTSNKWSATACKGFQIHIRDPLIYRPYRTTLKILQSVIFHHEDRFEWKPPPYEYEFDRMPIDLIMGDREVRQRLEAFEPIGQIEASWQADLDQFRTIRRSYLLYK
ncbi:MAG: DUF1343 domain-containing protein [Desulfobacterales bacterium]|jgi:uncharacterized protein YbbC (DUF1343 family)